MQWEHIVMEWTLGAPRKHMYSKTIEKQMDELDEVLSVGKQGWELVSTAMSDGTLLLFFKRPQEVDQ